MKYIVRCERKHPRASDGQEAECVSSGHGGFEAEKALEILTLLGGQRRGDVGESIEGKGEMCTETFGSHMWFDLCFHFSSRDWKGCDHFSVRLVTTNEGQKWMMLNPHFPPTENESSAPRISQRNSFRRCALQDITRNNRC